MKLHIRTYLIIGILIASLSLPSGTASLHFRERKALITACAKSFSNLESSEMLPPVGGAHRRWEGGPARPIDASSVAVGAAPIMFWNLENYFDTYDNPDTADDEFTPRGLKHWTRRRFENKRNIIAKTIISIKDTYGTMPSLIGLAEVETYGVLKELTQNTPLAKEGYAIIHHNSQDPRGIEPALLYREDHFTPLDTRRIEIPSVDTLKKLRHILYVKGLYLFPDGLPDTLHLFINHWPSKLGNTHSAELNRLAAARTLAAQVDSIHLCAIGADRPIPRIILMGDFNDSPESDAVSLLTASATPMTNLAAPLKTGSHYYRGRWERIDQFIVSPPLRLRQMVIYTPRFLYHRTNSTLRPTPGRTYSGPRYLGGASDHFPILLIHPLSR